MTTIPGNSKYPKKIIFARPHELKSSFRAAHRHVRVLSLKQLWARIGGHLGTLGAVGPMAKVW